MPSRLNWKIAGVVIFLIIIGIGYSIYRNRQSVTPLAENVTEPPANEKVEPPIADVVESPVSPLASDIVSPVSPLSPIVLSIEEIFSEIDRAEATYSAGNYTETISITNELIAIDPNIPHAYNTRGNAYTALEHYDKALADYSRAIELDPTIPTAYYNRGRLYQLTEKYDEAVLDLQKSAALAPVDFGYRANGTTGLVYHQLGEYDKALEAFETSISYNENERADVYYYRGETYAALEDYEAAIADYQAAIERFSNYDLAYQSLGYAYYKSGQYEEALNALNQALQVSPDSPTPHFYLALVHLAQEQSDEAEAEALQAVETLDVLSEKERSFVLDRVRADLDTLAQENPDQADQINAIIDLLPEA